MIRSMFSFFDTHLKYSMVVYIMQKFTIEHFIILTINPIVTIVNSYTKPT